MNWEPVFSPGSAIAFLGLLLSALGFIATALRTQRKEVVDLNGRLVALETKIEIFWSKLCDDAARMLHKPHPDFARRDELIGLFLDRTITPDQVDELVDILKRLIEDGDAPTGDRMAASVLLRGIEARFPRK